LVLFVLVVSCSRHVASNVAPRASKSAALPAASSQRTQNSTHLRADTLDSPPSEVNLSFVAPALGEQVLIGDPESYRVQLTSAAAGPDIIGLELSLDAGRPRPLSLDHPTITLGELVSADAELTPGVHWLFAAPVAASGLVPRAPSGGPHAAKARRFFIGKASAEASGPSGAVWLRRPDGTYNGSKSSESVLFEAFVFSALGAELDTPCTITLESAAESGQLQLPFPFVLHRVPSGVYRVRVSATGASGSTTHFTVNRELAGDL
jgi:hypothetical protein